VEQCATPTYCRPPSSRPPPVAIVVEGGPSSRCGERERRRNGRRVVVRGELVEVKAEMEVAEGEGGRGAGMRPFAMNRF
jgi:hypothetical protein